MVNTMCKLLGIARRTYFHWKRDEDKNKAIRLIEKYFTKDELEEFLNTGEILQLKNDHEKEILYSIALTEYNKYINELINISLDNLCDQWQNDDNLLNYENLLFSNIPIFVYFEYIYDMPSDEFPLSNFTNDILNILFKYNTEKIIVKDFHYIFNANPYIISLFKYFNAKQNFSLFYNYSMQVSNEDNQVILKNEHLFLNILYLNVRDIQSQNLTQVEKNERLSELIANNQYDKKKNYVHLSTLIP